MKFDPPLIEAKFLRRYKRFFADFELEGEVVTAACANTGRMLGILNEGARAFIQRVDNPKRKLKWDWWIVEADGVLIGSHTGLPNPLGFRAVSDGLIPELAGYDLVERERKYGDENSRIDLLLTAAGKAPCFVEIKNVHLRDAAGLAAFPDSVTVRGLKHLRELTREVEKGNRAVMLYIIQRDDVTALRPYDEIDPAYGQGLRDAVAAGVEVLAYTCHVSVEEITLARSIPVKI